MNDTPTSAVSSVVAALKGQPLVLALVVMNLGLLGFTYYEGVQNWRQRGAYVLETQKLLARCITVDELERLQRLK